MRFTPQMALPSTRKLDGSTASRTAQRAIRAIRGIRVRDANFLALGLEQRSDVRHYCVVIVSTPSSFFLFFSFVFLVTAYSSFFFFFFFFVSVLVVGVDVISWLLGFKLLAVG